MKSTFSAALSFPTIRPPLLLSMESKLLIVTVDYLTYLSYYERAILYKSGKC